MMIRMSPPRPMPMFIRTSCVEGTCPARLPQYPKSHPSQFAPRCCAVGSRLRLAHPLALPDALGGPPANPHQPEATTGIEPVQDLLRALEPKVALYVEHFRVVGRGEHPS